MKTRQKGWPLLLLGILLQACASESSKNTVVSNESPLFTLLTANETGVKFKNILQENPQISYFDNPYIYNGGGVAVGDINNDGLPDLYFVSNIFSNKLYLNKGNLKFEDISVGAGIEASRGFKTGVAMVDLNHDGWLDIYVCRSHHPDPLVRADFIYINNKDLTFTERALELGIHDSAYTTHVAFLDYDNDGDLDIYQLNHPSNFDDGIRVRLKMGPDQKLVRRLDPESMDHSDHLYRNKGDGTFEDVSIKAGIVNSAFGLSTSLTDINNDGYTDIYVANDFIDPDIFYINNKNGTFSDRIYEYVKHTAQNSMGSDIADFNNDGYEDLITVDMLAETNERQKLMTTSMVLDRYETLLQYGYGHQIMRNSLQLNNGNGTFSEIGWLAGVAATEWSWSSLFADFDNDGLKDLFISNGIRRDMTDSEYIQFKRDTVEALVKTGAPYVTPQTMQKWLDRMPQVKVHNYMYRNKGNLQFEDVSEKWGFSLKTFSNGTVYADLDLDGDLDIVTNDLDSTVLIYRNESDKLPKRNNYLQFQFQGPAKNPFGIGTRVTVWTNGVVQVNDLKSSRGFLSSVEPVLHFGMGAATIADSILVKWPDGRAEKLRSVSINQRISLAYQKAKSNKTIPAVRSKPLFSASTLPVSFNHIENPFNDFEMERLLPHKFSKSGPSISVADVNNDGLEDFFRGGAMGKRAEIIFQDPNGKFTASSQPHLHADSVFEDVASIFFDADQDKDMDLLVVSGGYEFGASGTSYQHRLYLNDGAGLFIKSNLLPVMEYSGSCVSISDMDLDGDNDIFIGGRVVPGSYGQNPKSYLLRNDGVQFTDVTTTFNPALSTIGMVTDATWQDLNNDSYPELILTGEWMPITVLQNQSGKTFIDISNELGFANTNGWWNCLTVLDFDKDGDMDIMAGNLGWNSLLKANQQEPMELYSYDFDGNGSVEGIICSFMGGKSWPLPRRELIVQQIPSLKKKFVRFEKYSRSTISEVFEEDKLQQALHRKVFTLSSSYWINDNGKYKRMDLPVEAQVSPINTIKATDINGDGVTDLLLGGNNFGIQVELGRYDAGNGLVLLGTLQKSWKALSIQQSGLFIPGEIRDCESINVGNKNAWLFAENNGPLHLFYSNK
jgi:enediyne biosynthesis protein E4